MWQDGHIVIDVICHMANASAGYRVDSHRYVILKHAHHAVAEDEDLWSDGGVVEVAIAVVEVVTAAASRRPTRALTVAVLLLTLPTLKWLLPVDKFVPIFVAIIAGPRVPAWDVVGAEFDVRLPYAIVEAFGVAKFQFRRRFDDRRSMLDEKIIEEAVADHRHFTFTRLVKLYINRRF